ncbi:hypothetical protein BGZ46_010287 [Entomortierella lignicola]|nr:hypothetical protein BGZ46_010287 [Entomortierella lignicola]
MSTSSSPSNSSSDSSNANVIPETPVDNSTSSGETPILSLGSEQTPSAESSNNIPEDPSHEDSGEYSSIDDYESDNDDEDDIDMPESITGAQSGGASTSTDENQSQEVDMQDDEEFVMEMDPATGQRRAITVPTSTGRSRSSSLASRLRRQQRRMTSSVRFAATARPTSRSSNRLAAETVSTSTTPVVPLIDENVQSALRKKILDIQRNPDIGMSEKASLIQKLMSSNWQGSKKETEQQAKDDSGVPTEEDLKTTYHPCGHSIHAKCHEEYVLTSYQCPTCWKALGDMSRYYQKIDTILADQIMPPEYANIFSTVLCNDCEVKSEAPYHFIYHKCDKCKGYNTKVLETFRRSTNDQDQKAENATAAGASGTAPENNISGASGIPAGPTSLSGDNSTITTIVHLPDVSQLPLADGNTSEEGLGNMTSSTGNSAP